MGDTRTKRRGGDADCPVKRGKYRSTCGRGVRIERRELAGCSKMDAGGRGKMDEEIREKKTEKRRG